MRAELFAGFSASTATIAPKYFYDALGSRLFSAITELPEYYPTRTEAAIFARHAGHMAQALGPVSTLVDLGAGNCEKAASLFAAFHVQRYVAVDISASYLRDSLECLQRKHPAMDMLGIGLDFSQTLNLAGRSRRRAAHAVLSRFEHRQFHPGRGAGFSPPGACRLRRRRPADRRRSGQAGGYALSAPTTTRWASPPPSTATCCATSMRWSAPTSTLPTGVTSRSSTLPNHASRCIWKRWPRPSSAGRKASAALHRASGCTPRIPTSGAPTTLPACWKARGFRGCSSGPTSTSWFAVFAAFS